MSKRFEYMQCLGKFRTSSFEIYGIISEETLYLNDLGRTGWELVATIENRLLDHSDKHRFILLFKREVNEVNETGE